MTIPTFEPLSNPDSGTERDIEPRVLVNKFGDGYEQVSNNGINSMLETIAVKWSNANYLEGSYIIDFFKAVKGSAFYWQMNNEGPILTYRLKSLSHAKKKGRYFDITANFIQTAPQ